MGRGNKSKNTFSFSSSGYSSQSLSEFDHNNKTNSTVNNSDFCVRTSTPTSHDLDMISQQQPATVYTIDTLDYNNNETPTRYNNEDKRSIFEAIISFIFKIFTCFNLFKKHNNKASRTSSPVNSIYDNFNEDLQKYTLEMNSKKAAVAAAAAQKNYYTYRPTLCSNTVHSTSTLIPQQQYEHQVPLPFPITQSNYYTPYNCNTRNSTFINHRFSNEEITKPYLSSSSISSIEASIQNNSNKQRSYSVDSIIKQNSQFTPRHYHQRAHGNFNNIKKNYSIDSVVPSSVSTSFSSLETAISCSSSVSLSKQHSKLASNYNNLKFISPIVNNSCNLPTHFNRYYDKAPNVMIQLEKMSLKRPNQPQYYNIFQQDRQLPLLNPIYDDWMCDKEVESYFENPVYFDCYNSKHKPSQSCIYQKNYYNNKFKSESYC